MTTAAAHGDQIIFPRARIAGNDGEYGTMDPLDRIGRVSPVAGRLAFGHGGHSSHRPGPGTTWEPVDAVGEELE